MKHGDPHLHVRGESVFVDDLPAPAGALHAVVLGSPTAHGAITSLDVSAALKHHGVVAVLTAADIPGENQIGANRSGFVSEPVFQWHRRIDQGQSCTP